MTYFEILVLRFIRLWLGIKIVGWKMDDAERLRNDVTNVIIQSERPTTGGSESE